MIESELFGHEPGAFTGALKKRIGRIEHAQGGTLFLDEIEAMSPALQVKLLRVLETRQITPLGTNDVRRVNIRIVAATKVDLLALAKQGSFREDLYYRLHVVKIRIPPLRERRADIPLLFGHFLARAAKRFGRAQPAIGHRERHFLLEHSWPGNIRELAHYAERVALGLDGDASPDSEFLPLPKRVEAYEGSLIREALAASRGDIQGTLHALGIPRKTFYDKLHRHGIDQSKYREAKPS